MDARASSNRKQLKSAWFGVARNGALLAILVSVAADVEARGGGGGFRGGGGIRGGGSMSMSRGSSFNRGSYDRGSGSYRSGGTFSRDGSYSKPSALDRKPSGLDRPGGSGSGTNWDAMTRVPSSGGSATQLPANRPGGGGSGTEWRPDCPKCSDGGGGWVDHPVAAGIAIGAIAGAAAAIGSTYYYLPADCPPYYWSGIYYYSCDGIFYEPQYEGDTVVYVTVPDPSAGQQPAK